jgi:RNA polymerase sigma-70 factor, ECF subfamily
MEADGQKERDQVVRDLTARMASGSEIAFAALYKLIFYRLFRYTLVQTGGDEELTKEITQGVLVRWVRYTRSFDNERALWSWLRRVVRSCHIDLLRKRAREPFTVSLELCENRNQESDSSHHEDAEILNALDKSLNRLDASERQMVHLAYFEEVPHRDIAARLQTTEKAVESKLARTREKLRRVLLNCLHENVLL